MQDFALLKQQQISLFAVFVVEVLQRQGSAWDFRYEINKSSLRSVFYDHFCQKSSKSQRRHRELKLYFKGYKTWFVKCENYGSHTRKVFKKKPTENKISVVFCLFIQKNAQNISL